MPTVRSIGAIPFCFAALLWQGTAAAQAPAVRVDGIAAVVGSGSAAEIEIILRSDVELRARMALAAKIAGPVPLGPVPLDLLVATLRELVGEHLIAREARKVQAATVSAAERTAEHARLVRAGGGDARVAELVAALGADATELDAAAERRALVARFLRANLEGATVVTDAQVERVLAAEREARGVAYAVPTPDADELERRAIRARLSREALDRAIEHWVAVLSARTSVRIHADYDSE